MNRPITIGITCGDCNGIGLEVFLKAFASTQIQNLQFSAFLFIHPAVLADTLQMLPLALPLSFDPQRLLLSGKNNAITIIPIEPYAPVRYGQPTEEAALLAYHSLQAATSSLTNSTIDALLTLPINKMAMVKVGFTAAGQTDWLAEQFNVANYMMLFWSPSLLLGLATIHVPIRKVPELLETGNLRRKILLLHQSLQKLWKIPNPTIALLGLNPHAGENGLLGTEELEILLPLIQQLRNDGYDIDGPFPADAFFARKRYQHYDATVAMYHDQGLIPLKIIAQNTAVNLTIGLPFLRTSPDHGTAYDIAGKGVADPTSCIHAFLLLHQLAMQSAQQDQG